MVLVRLLHWLIRLEILPVELFEKNDRGSCRILAITTPWTRSETRFLTFASIRDLIWVTMTLTMLKSRKRVRIDWNIRAFPSTSLR